MKNAIILILALILVACGDNAWMKVKNETSNELSIQFSGYLVESLQPGESYTKCWYIKEGLHNITTREVSLTWWNYVDTSTLEWFTIRTGETLEYTISGESSYYHLSNLSNWTISLIINDNQLQLPALQDTLLHYSLTPTSTKKLDIYYIGALIDDGRFYCDLFPGDSLSVTFEPVCAGLTVINRNVPELVKLQIGDSSTDTW
ncbi:MAG: hypothetical protein K8S56_00630, partial [Candidatus Cloacimonetes bacterium]|nr:hypothetical protein [Candidatus Cloacimonadota bacterium]